MLPAFPDKIYRCKWKVLWIEAFRREHVLHFYLYAQNIFIWVHILILCISYNAWIHFSMTPFLLTQKCSPLKVVFNMSVNIWIYFIEVGYIKIYYLIFLLQPVRSFLCSLIIAVLLKMHGMFQILSFLVKGLNSLKYVFLFCI